MKELLSEIILRRSLIRELVIKDLKLRYARSYLGFFWALLSPLLVVAIFYLVFSIILQVKIQEAPFFLYLMSAVFSWRFFQDSVMSSATCLLDNKNLIRESGFGQYLVPLSVVLANGVNYLLPLGILICCAGLILRGLPIFIFILPFVLLVHFIFTLGVSLVVSLLYIKWRDTKYILEALLLVLFYLTPAFYSLSFVKNSFPPFLFRAYIFNPLVGILNLYRVACLKGFFLAIKEEMGILSLLIMPLISAAIWLYLGLYFYQQQKGKINDYLSY